MKIVVVSPPDEHADEQRWVSDLLAAGLERYHVRKPGWSAERTADFVASLPSPLHGRLVLHAHPGLAQRFDLLGLHARDGLDEAAARPGTCFRSRACHDPAAVERALGNHSAVFFGPVFASLSKPGYGPAPEATLRVLARILARRDCRRAATEVLAIGGVTAEGLARCKDLGFDGAAVLGAVWDSPDPLAAYLALEATARVLADTDRQQRSSI